MRRLHIDFETFSEVDIRKAGHWKYAKDRSTRVLCMSWAFDEDPVRIWIPGGFFPGGIHNHVARGGEVAGHNVGFEYAIWNHVLADQFGLPLLKPEQLIDTAAKAARMSLPRSLADCAKALGLSEKDETGRAVMLQLSQPRRPSKNNPDTRWTPEAVPHKFQQLYDYCIRDTVVEREIDHALPDLPPAEQKLWVLDLKINERGLNIDLDLVDTILEMNDQHREALEAECVSLIGCRSSERDTVLDRAKMHGYPLPGYTKQEVAAAVADPRCPDKIRRVLEIRQETGKTSIAKFAAFKNATCADGRLRGMFLYYGAGTGRWAGKIVQLHNLARGIASDTGVLVDLIRHRDTSILDMVYGSTSDAFSSAIRPVIIPSPGNELVVTDYTGIEARQVQWLARDEDALAIFRTGVDGYKAMAAEIYGVPYDQVTKPMRFIGKKAILGLGYNMGVETFIESCAADGVFISQELAERAVKAYRALHTDLVDLWRDIEYAAKASVRGRREVEVNDLIHFEMWKDWLFMHLPSGRPITYFKPTLEVKKTPWGQEREQIHYWTTDSVTRKFRKNSTYGGKLVENATQAVSRDILAMAMYRLDRMGHNVVGHVHDEIIADVPIGSLPVCEMERIMCHVPRWGRRSDRPELDMVVQAEGSILQRYQK